MKLPRFNSFAEMDEKTTQGSGWSQHVTLPLQPEVYAAYQKQQKKEDTVKKSGGQAKKETYAVLGNEHILGAIGDLIRAINLDGHDVIQYILDNDLEKGESIDRP